MYLEKIVKKNEWKKCTWKKNSETHSWKSVPGKKIVKQIVKKRCACYQAKASRIPVRPFLLYVCAVVLPWDFPYSQVTIVFYYFFAGAVPVTIFFIFFFTIHFQVHFQSVFLFTFLLLIIYFMVSRGWLKSPFTNLLHNP